MRTWNDSSTSGLQVVHLICGSDRNGESILRSTPTHSVSQSGIVQIDLLCRFDFSLSMLMCFLLQHKGKMPTFEEKYIIGEELGKGAYATVYRCTHRERGDHWAVKVIDKSKAGPKDISDVMHEVNMMKEIGHHPNVVRLLEFFDTPAKMFLVLEVLEGGMLFDRVVQLKHYSEACASRLIKNFLLALEHIHAKGIMHRDLKPENLLLKRQTKTSEDDSSHLTDFCVADFGLSGKSPGQTCCGSPSYIAPEVINVGYLRTQKEPYDTKCDMWSVGVIAYILLSGKMPFHGRNFKETFAKIVKGQWAFVGDVWEKSVSASAKDFIKQLLTMDPKHRPSAPEALQHPWVAKVQADVHLASSLDGIKQFNAERKLRAAMLHFRATSSLLGKLDKTPPFLKYLSHANKLSTVIQSQSQTDANRVHHIDYSRALLRDTPGWKMQDCCTCGSSQVCRHIQNVHEYLWFGRKDYDVFPFVNELEAMLAEAEYDFADDPTNEKVKITGEEVKECLKAAQVFHEEFTKVPREQMKANFTAVTEKQPDTDKAVASAINIFKKK